MSNGEYEFVIKTSNKEKLRALLVLLSVLVILLAFSYLFTPRLVSYWQDQTTEKSFFLLVKDKLTDVSPLGIFSMSFIGGSIFVLMPIELFYWLGISNGNSLILSFIAVNAGFILMQFVNYWLGLKLSYFFFTFVSKSKVYATRRKVNSYGAWAVFLLNVTPSPSELLTFALGITRYNKTRLFVVLALANIIKFSIITLFYIIFFK